MESIKDDQQKHEMQSSRMNINRFFIENNSKMSDFQIVGELNQGEDKNHDILRVIDKKSGRQRVIQKFVIQNKDINNIKDKQIQNNIIGIQELQNLQKLDHPNILKLYEVFQQKETVHLVLEFCQGLDLKSELINRPMSQTQPCFSEDEARQIFLQLMSALTYAHDNKVIHRDIKSENILFIQQQMDEPQEEKQGVSNKQVSEKKSVVKNFIKVIDWDISSLLTEDQDQEDFSGTLQFMAPEILQEQKLCEQVDIWSSGIVLYEMIQGNTPFFRNGLNNLTQNLIIRGQVQFQKPLWKQISADAQDLIKSMLIKNPKQRISAQQVLEHAWFKNYQIKISSESSQSQDIKKQSEEKQRGIELLNFLQRFSTKNQVQTVVLYYIVKHVLDPEFNNSILNEFKSIDQNLDGVISFEQLVLYYQDIKNVSQASSKEIVAQMMKNIDLDKSNSISFSEYACARLKQFQIENEKNLHEAFDFLDQNQDKKISFQEIKILYENRQDSVDDQYRLELDEQAWKSMISQFDLNNDGEINYQEFQIMMFDYAQGINE